jgi:hypothetical protein
MCWRVGNSCCEIFDVSKSVHRPFSMAMSRRRRSKTSRSGLLKNVYRKRWISGESTALLSFAFDQ